MINKLRMLEFTIYGIENDKFINLMRLLSDAMSTFPLSYKIQRVTNIDDIISSGVVSIPSIYYKSTLISEEELTSVENMRKQILHAIENDLTPEQLKKVS